MMKDNMKHVCACMLGVVLLCVSATAYAAVDFDEGFEYSGNAAWLGSGNWAASSCTAAEHTGIMEISSERVFRGTKSLKYTYAGLNPVKTCFLDHYFPRKPEIWTRVYLFLDNFSPPSTVPTKMFFYGEKAYPNVWTLFHRSAIDFSISWQGPADSNLSKEQLVGSIPQGRWICIEEHIKMNTPGVPDGVVQSWVDGVQSHNLSNLLLRNATNTATTEFRFTRLYRQHGFGNFYLDQYAVGSTRIGCLGEHSTDDTNPPAPPSKFVVN